MAGIGQSGFLQALGWAVFNSLWQMALLWILYQLATILFRPLNSSRRSSLAAALLITGFGWFIYTFISILVNSNSGSIVASGFLDVAGDEQLNKWFNNTLPAASLIYLVLLILPVLHFARNYRYVQLIRSQGLSKVDVQWRIFVQKVRARMGINKHVQVWLSDLVGAPVTIGYLKPMILLPLAAVNQLTTQQIEAVLLHELSHIRRFDYLINLLTRIIKTILYFNPFVAGFVKMIESEREKSCDEMVMQFQYDPHGYASALLTLEKANRPSLLVLSAAGRKNDLLTRIEIILGIHKKPVVTFNRLAGFLATLLCIIGLNAILIWSKPQKGNKGVNFSALSSPFYFFTGDENPAPVLVKAEEISPEIINHTSKTENSIAAKKAVTKKTNPVASLLPGFINVSYEPVLTPELKVYQEEQVELALEASKKVLEEAQWKAAEKGLADVFTQKEKAALKQGYLLEVGKFDWKKWEDKLKLAYNQIDWDRINLQLDNAINNIRVDSLQKVYSIAARDLGNLQKELSETELKGIPDTDITVEGITQKKVQVQKLLNKINAVRSKKVIHL
jgi:beta-lactamase regulating signal transducer with metallopeptidase domain